MKVDTTDEWKKWMKHKSTREEDIEKKSGSVLPIYNSIESEWIVYHPHSDIYMIVDHQSYITEWNKR